MKISKYIILFLLVFLLLVLLPYRDVIAGTILKADWRLLYVDSEELVGEDGAAVNAFDGDVNTFWHTKWLGKPDPPHPHEIRIDLGDVYDIDGFRYLPSQENGNIDQYEFYVSADGIGWGTAVAGGSFVNDLTEKEVLFSTITGRFVRLVALSEVNGKPWTSMLELSVLGGSSSGNQVPVGTIDTPAGNTNINVGDSIDFSGTGADPDGNTPLTFRWDFGDPSIAHSTVEDPGLIQFNNSGVFIVSFMVTDGLGLSDPTPATRTITVTVGGGGSSISKAGWSLLYVDSEELVGEDGAAVNAFDGDVNTFWHTKWLGKPDPPHPHEIRIDLGDVYDIDGFRYLPSQENGNIDQYEFYVSADGINWGTAVAGGSFVNDLTEKEVLFSTITGRFVRLVALSEVNGKPWTSMVELSVLGGSSSGNQVPVGTIDTPTGNTNINVGDSIDFSGTGADPDENTPLSFRWDFGDPSIADSTVEDPGLIQFNNSGVFTVSFTVTDLLGLSDPAPDTRTITVVSSGNQAPDGTINTPTGNTNINVGDSIDFSGTGADPDENTPLSFRWDFGDPSIADSTVEDPGFIQFNNSGVFTVSFTVTDDLGLSDPTPAAQTVTVTVGGGGSSISKAGWRLLYVDSEELEGEDGAAVNAFDGDVNTFWHTKWLGKPDPPHPHEIRIDLGDVYDIDGFRYLPGQENGNIDQYEFYVSADGINWGTAVAGGSFVNDLTEKEVLFSTITGRFVRLVALSEVNGKPWTSMLELSVLGGSSSGNQVPVGTIDTPAGNTNINVGDSIDFSGTGADPDGNTPLTFRWDFGDPAITGSTAEDPGLIQFNNSGVFIVSFMVTDGLGLSDPSPAFRTITVTVGGGGSSISKAGWSLLYVDSEETVAANQSAINAFDGNPLTFWNTKWLGSDTPHPHEIRIDLGDVYDIDGFRYLPRQDGNPNGRIIQFAFYVSLDGTNWGSAVAIGSLEDDPLEKEIAFPVVSAQSVRLVALSEVNGNPWTSMSELDVLGKSFSGNFAPDSIIDSPETNISINVGDSIVFSGSGNDSDNNLPLSFLWSFGDGSGVSDSNIEDPGTIQYNIPGTYTITLNVTDALGRPDSTPANRVIKVMEGINDTILPQTDWALLFVDSEELVGENGAAVNAFDGSSDTFWHTEWLYSDPPHPHEIQIDIGGAFEIDTFRYLPIQSEVNGRVLKYEIYISPDGKNWGVPVSSGFFLDDFSEKYNIFEPKFGRFIRFRALEEVNGNPWASMAEINIEGKCEAPYVGLIQPTDFYIQPSPTLNVSASVCLDKDIYPDWTVKFSLDGGIQSGGMETTVNDAPFEATFSNISLSEHIVEVFILNDLGEEVSGPFAYDSANPVGIGGYYVAIGDSITAGHGDDIFFDNISSDNRNKDGGYTPILSNLLTQFSGYPHTVEMEGVPGDTSVDGLQKLPSVLSTHPNAQYYLLIYGTNDAIGLLPVPSGLGLKNGDSGYDGSFKDNIKQMMNSINNEGKEVFLAKVPFTLEPDTNIIIQEYNQVIDELISEHNIQVIPPDFYNYFETNQNELSDSFHPNGNGYQSMADMWFNALQ